MSRFLRLPGSAGARLSPGRSSPALTGLRGPPPGHRLRSGGYMAATKKRDQGKISPLDVSTLFRGTPLFVPKPTSGVGCQDSARSDLRSAVHGCPLASAGTCGDRYSLRYSVRVDPWAAPGGLTIRSVVIYAGVSYRL